MHCSRRRTGGAYVCFLFLFAAEACLSIFVSCPCLALYFSCFCWLFVGVPDSDVLYRCSYDRSFTAFVLSLLIVVLNTYFSEVSEVLEGLERSGRLRGFVSC